MTASGKLVLVKEERLQGDYSLQRETIMNLKEHYRSRGFRTEVVIDATVVGDVVADTFGSIIDYRLWYSPSTKSQRPEIDKWGTWKYGKRDLVHMTQAMMQERMVYADSSLTMLMSEMKQFKGFSTPAGNVKYEAATGHDDVVNAMMLTCFHFGHLS